MLLKPPLIALYRLSHSLSCMLENTALQLIVGPGAEIGCIK